MFTSERLGNTVERVKLSLVGLVFSRHIDLLPLVLKYIRRIVTEARMAWLS